MSPRPLIPIILGPTATGKSALAIELALRHNGEVISADSRQVYTGLDIGTGKVTTEEMRGIPHHLLDIADPHNADAMSVALWKEAAERSIADILSRGKVPIVCGGTGFYIQALVDNVVLPDTPKNERLRAELEERSAEELFAELENKDPERAETIDRHNKRRLIRALEIIDHMGKVPLATSTTHGAATSSNSHGNHPLYDFILIGLELPPEELRTKISTRLIQRIDAGMINEARTLHAAGLTYERMNELGLEYRYLAELLQNKLSHDEFITTLTTKIWQYAKRQMTWFKRDSKIAWFDAKDSEMILNRISELLIG